MSSSRSWPRCSRRLVEALDSWLATLFDPERIDETCEILATASEPDEVDATRLDAARRKIADAKARIARYQAALDNGADPQVVAAWINEAQGDKLAGQRELDAASPIDSLSAEDVRALVEELGDVRSAPASADPSEKALLYTEMGVHAVYRPEATTVEVTASPITACTYERVGGGT